MTIFKIILVGVMLATVLAVAKSQMWFERAGIVAHCSEVAPPAGRQREGGQWWACTKGSVTGYPSLSRDSCESRGLVGGREYWTCPAALERAPF